MPGFIHQHLAAGRWFELTLCEQMGNIGSEIGRAAKYVRDGDTERKDKAMDRAFELIDLTMSDARWRGPKLREICRFREVCADTFYGNQEYHTTPEDLDKYLMQFALAARRGR